MLEKYNSELLVVYNSITRSILTTIWTYMKTEQLQSNNSLNKNHWFDWAF